MQSFFFEKDQDKNISAQKSHQKPSLSSMNPFYEYITSKKSLNLPVPEDGSKTQRPSSVSIPTQPSTSSERKNSSELSDPRRIYASKNLQVFENKVEQAQNIPLPKASRNSQLNQKRSRSRDQRKSKNRQTSQDRFENERKEEHFKKTKLCPLYEKGQCKKGSSCSFAHGFKDLRCLPNFYKTKLCLAFEKGECKKSIEQCKYAHGEKELRSLKHDAGYSDTIMGFQKKREKSHDQHKKHKNDRQSESVHRKDKQYHKSSHHREDSREIRKETSKVQKDPLSYKKNIPLNKDYEKFLYGDLNPQSPVVQSNAFFNNKDSTKIESSSRVHFSSSYSKDAYLIDFRKPYVHQQNSSGYPSIQRPNSNFAYQSYESRELTTLPSYEKSLIGYSQKNNLQFNERDFFSLKNQYPEIPQSFSSINQNYQSYGRPQYGHLQQGSADLSQHYKNDSYQNSSQGSFREQTYSNFSIKESRLPNSSLYFSSYVALPQEYPLSNKVADRSESFYKKDSFCSDVNTLPSQNGSSYRHGFSKNEVYDLYPALDKSFNQVATPSYNVPTFHQKSKYSGFSNTSKK